MRKDIETIFDTKTTDIYKQIAYIYSTCLRFFNKIIELMKNKDYYLENETSKPTVKLYKIVYKITYKLLLYVGLFSTIGFNWLFDYFALIISSFYY